MSRFRHALRFTIILCLAFFCVGQIKVSDANASRDSLHGTTLATYCAGKFDVDAGVCTGYILAISEALIQGSTVFGYKACGHDVIKGQQLVDIVKFDLSENPDQVNQPAGAMVAGILSRSFPCYDVR